MPTMTQVSGSKMVKAHGYDPLTKTLTIEFTSGGAYHYDDVPQEKYDAMVKASSIGSFVHANLKGKHTARKAGA